MDLMMRDIDVIGIYMKKNFSTAEYDIMGFDD